MRQRPKGKQERLLSQTFTFRAWAAENRLLGHREHIENAEHPKPFNVVQHEGAGETSYKGDGRRQAILRFETKRRTTKEIVVLKSGDSFSVPSSIDLGHVLPPERYLSIPGAEASDMSMMRIAVAGTGGLARMIAHYIDSTTGHHVVFLSRTQQPQLSQSYQVAVVDYDNAQSLQFALRGIDTVISTVTGPHQIEIIKAAVTVRVRRFAPAEFEGPPTMRPADDPVNRFRTLARQWLAHYAQHIQSTTFVCGILYERLQPGGLAATLMGGTAGVGFSGEGDYIMDCRAMEAMVPCWDANNRPDVTICMTAAQDVGRFVTAALDLPSWPPELRMYGHRTTVWDLALLVQRLQARPFQPLRQHNPASLQSELSLAIAQGDNGRQMRIRMLLATAEGRYDYTHANLHQLFPAIRPIPFAEWFSRKWNVQQSAKAKDDVDAQSRAISRRLFYKLQAFWLVIGYHFRAKIDWALAPHVLTRGSHIDLKDPKDDAPGRARSLAYSRAAPEILPRLGLPSFGIVRMLMAHEVEVMHADLSQNHAHVAIWPPRRAFTGVDEGPGVDVKPTIDLLRINVFG
nr:hypothetical protein CFP56_62722 [Quercus suber]